MLTRVTSQVLCGCRGVALKIYRSSSSVNTSTEKFIKVAILGSPNAGKSTLVNSLVGNRVCAVSHVANTTRTQLNGVLTIDNTQLVLTDTPGAVSYMEGRRLKMHSTHLRSPRHATDLADMIAVVTDVGNRKTRNYIDDEVLKIIDEYSDLPVVLVLNKIDRLKRKEELLFITSILTADRKKDEWGYLPHGGSKRFSECFFTCALTSEGNDQFINYLVSVAKQGKWEYSEGAYCDTSVDTLINEVFREKLLVMFGQEIPWKVKQVSIFL